jgi:hypothetical protein
MSILGIGEPPSASARGEFRRAAVMLIEAHHSEARSAKVAGRARLACKA